jgi:hypothetical protein
MSRRHRGKEPSVVAQLEWELGADWIEHASDCQLLELGSVVAGTDYAVLHYLHDWHGKFFGQRELLEKAVRRGLARSDISFDRAIFVLQRASGGEAATRADQAMLTSVEVLRGVLLRLSDEEVSGDMELDLKVPA